MLNRNIGPTEVTLKALQSGRLAMYPEYLPTWNTTVAGYRIDDVLGEGGMGVVYRATQLSLNRVVALKLLTGELAQDTGFRTRFQREGQLQAALDHDHVEALLFHALTTTKPAWAKWWSLVRTCRMSCSSISTIDMQSVREYSLSGRCS